MFNQQLQTLSQPTHPCATAYDCARIRRLVRLGSELYRFRVADESAIGFRSPVISRRTTSSVHEQVLYACQSMLWRLCVGGLRVCRF
jgi:hypothetical protein